MVLDRAILGIWGCIQMIMRLTCGDAVLSRSSTKLRRAFGVVRRQDVAVARASTVSLMSAVNPWRGYQLAAAGVGPSRREPSPDPAWSRDLGQGAPGAVLEQRVEFGDHDGRVAGDGYGSELD
jgi:hypothetical protein